MKKTLTAIFLGAIVISFAFISCKKNSDPAPDQHNIVANFYSTSLAGLGNHGGTPSGNAFVLPSNIKIIGSMRAGDPGNKSGIFQFSKTLENIPNLTKGLYTEYGIGTYVNVYVKFYNTLSTPYKLIIPSGVIMCDSFPNDSTIVDTTQGGIIIPPDTIDIGGNDTIRACLRSFCLNLHHAAPSVNNVYKFAVITNNNQLSQVVGILKNKKTLASHVSEIQSIIWNITDGPGLTQADIDLMNSWQ